MTHLEFVNQNVITVRKYTRILSEQLQAEHQQIIEIERISFPKSNFVFYVQLTRISIGDSKWAKPTSAIIDKVLVSLFCS